MTAPDNWTCIVCGEMESSAMLAELCGGCGEFYHYNQTSGPGKDCGAAWMDDEDSGMVFFCNTCMNTARAEDEQRIEEITRAAATGMVTPDMLAQLLEALQKTGGGQPASPLAGFPGMAPGMPGMPTGGLPGGMGFPGPISGADLGRMFGQPLPADDDEDDEATAAPADGAPPLLPSRRPRAERRYRRIQ
jgi:hypothetical protein